MDIKNSCEPFCMIRGEAYCGNKMCNKLCALKRLSELDIDEYKVTNVSDGSSVIVCQFSGKHCEMDCFLCELSKKVLEEF